MAKRFYQLTYKNTGQSIFFEDAGNKIKIAGLLLEGMGTHVLVIAPGGTIPERMNMGMNVETTQPTLEKWCELIRQTDDPVYFDETQDSMIKAVHRKMRMSVSGAVQQKIWVRDSLQCLLCGRKMGDVQLSIDHWIPLELGGVNNETNYISACRKCNKRKGSEHPKDYCKRMKLDYQLYVDYLDPNELGYSANLIADRAQESKRKS